MLNFDERHCLNLEMRHKLQPEKKGKKSKTRSRQSHAKFITTYLPALSNANKVIQNNLSIFHTDEGMRNFFSSNSPTTLHRRENNLRKFYLLPHFHLNLTKMKVQSVAVINVMPIEIILIIKPDKKFQCKVLV